MGNIIPTSAQAREGDDMTDSGPDYGPAETALTTYSATEAVLTDLRDRFANVAWDVSTTVGMANAKEARAEINGWLTGLEKERKAQKSEHLKAGKRIDSEAKDIAAELLTLKEPPDKAIKEVEQRKKREEAEAARIEEERVAKCRAEIDGIRALPLAAVGLKSEAIQALADPLIGFDTSRLAEFSGVAESAIRDTLAKLDSMRDDARAQEDEQARIAKEREELEKLRVEQEARAEEERVYQEGEAKRRAKLEAEVRAKQAAEDRERRAKIEADEKEARERREKADAEARESRAKQEAEARKARAAEDAKLQKERERLEAQEIEAKIAREKVEADERERLEDLRKQEEELRRVQDEKEGKLRKAEADRKRADEEKAYAEEMGAQRQRDMLLDGRAMLVIFIERFGDVEEFATVAGQIKGYLAASKG